MTDENPGEGDKKPDAKENGESNDKPDEKGDDSPASSPLLDETKKTVEELNKATAEMKKERAKMEKVSSDLALQGKGLITKTPPPKATDEEYADKFLKGEVNPLKDDGII